MFTEMLNELPNQAQIKWLPSMEGIRVCTFRCEFSRTVPPASVPGRQEVLFCLDGSLALRWKNASLLYIQEKEILLISDGSQIERLDWARQELQGILVAVDTALAHDSFANLCALLGGTVDPSRVKSELDAQGGCAVIPRTSWGDMVFQTILELPPEQAGAYCAFFIIEVFYHLCSDTQRFPWKERITSCSMQHISQVRQAHGWLMEHWNKGFTIEQLSRQFHISSTTLKRCFRQIYGKPLLKYMQEYRMGQAAKILTTTELPVADVAHQVGYESVGQFRAVFQRVFRETPTAFRKKCRIPSFICPNPPVQSADGML